MKTIVFVKGGDILKRAMPIKEWNAKAYAKLFEMGESQDLQMVWSSFIYWKRNSFSAYSEYKNGEWVRHKKTIRPDFVVDRSLYKYEHIPIKQKIEVAVPFMDSAQLEVIFRNKLITYFAFPKIVHPCLIIRNQQDLQHALTHTKSKKIVLKPVSEFGGKEVEIVTRNQGKNKKVTEPIIFQEFIDSSKGIPGLYKGVHDMRLLFLNNKLIHAYIRTPACGTQICNVTLGGDRILVPLVKVPKKLKKICNVFQKRFAQFPHIFYSVDFIYKDGRDPKVIELNLKPGLSGGDGASKHHQILFNRLLDYFQSVV